MAGEATAAAGGPAAPEAAAAAAKRPHKPQVVRIEVLGDEKVGKTSLICSLVSRHFSEKVPSVLLNVQIPAEESDENVIISITDTSSRVSDLMRVSNAVKRSDAILLVYDVTRPETFQRLRRWLDYIARNKEVPVVLVANKADMNTVSSTTDAAYAAQARHLISSYPFVVSRVECSAKNFTQVAQAFFLAQKAVLYPISPLYNEKKREVEPKCLKAIKRAFRLYNKDRSGLLSREELNEYQQDCFGMRLLATEMDTMMEFLASAVPDGVSPSGSGIYLDGFIFLWKLFIDRNRPESCWQVLRTLGYNNELHLEIPPERLALPPMEDDQSAQLSTDAVEFLTNLFHQFDRDKDGKLADAEIDEVFSICEDTDAPWLTCSALAVPLRFETSVVDGTRALPLSSWLACWSFVAQENARKLLETLFYLGYDEKASPAIKIVRSRSLTRKAARIERNVVTCYMIGKPDWAKVRVVNTFVGRKSAPSTGSEDGELAVLCAIGAVVDKDVPRYLYITEPLRDEDVENLADVFCLVFDPADAESFQAVEELDKKLPASVPRVLLGLKADSAEAPAEGEPAKDAPATDAPVKDAATKDALAAKQFPGAVLCSDDKSVLEAMALLVSTALRPPKNARSGGSGMRTPVLVGVGLGVVALGLAALANQEKATSLWIAGVAKIPTVRR